MNQQNNNQNGHVKSKFFNEELFNNASINDIGSTTSGQVISYSVGAPKPRNTPPVEDVNVLDSTQVINLVNSDMADANAGLFDASKFSSSMEGYSVFDNTQQNYSNNIEDVLNESRMDTNIDTSHVSNQFAQENPAFYGYNADASIIAANNGVNSVAVDQNSMMMPQTNQMQVVQQPVMDQSQMMAQPQMMTQQSVMQQPQMMDQQMMQQPAMNQQPQMEQQTDQSMMQQPVMQPVFDQSMMQQPIFAQTQVVEQPQVTESVSIPQITNNERDLNPINFDASSGEIDNNLIVNQPLSLMALSGEAIDEAQKPKDVTENSKFFQSTPLEDNRLKPEEVIPVSVAPVVDVLAEPARNLNTKELVMSYIGPKYQKISMSPFSFCAFLFGPLYYFYRKMYLFGIIFVAINFLVGLLALKSIWIYLGAYAIVAILSGLLANNLILKNANTQVVKIAALNPNATQYDLVKISQKKGGTGLLIALVIVLCINTLTSSIYNFLGVNEALTTELTNMVNGTKVLKTDTSALLEDVIEYEYPITFVSYEEDPRYYVYYELETDEETEEVIKKPACLVGISLIAGYETSKDLIQEMADVEKRYNRVSTYEDYEKNIWDVYDYTVDGSHMTYRARMVKDHIVLITYGAVTSATPGVCELYLEEIMDSIKEK